MLLTDNPAAFLPDELAQSIPEIALLSAERRRLRAGL
jgi:hypothetical protein